MSSNYFVKKMARLSALCDIFAYFYLTSPRLRIHLVILYNILAFCVLINFVNIYRKHINFFFYFEVSLFEKFTIICYYIIVMEILFPHFFICGIS